MDISTNNIVTTLFSYHNANTHISALQREFQWVCDVVSVGREDSATCTATTLQPAWKVTRHSSSWRVHKNLDWVVRCSTPTFRMTANKCRLVQRTHDSRTQTSYHPSRHLCRCRRVLPLFLERAGVLYSTSHISWLEA